MLLEEDAKTVKAVYRAKHSWVAGYTARAQHGMRFGIATWEEAGLVVGGPVLGFLLAPVLQQPALFALLFGLMVGIGAMAALRLLAGRATTTRFLPPGKAITRLIACGNDELIEAAIDPVLALETDPKGAPQLVNELRSAWAKAKTSRANEKTAIITALRETAENFPTTNAGVEQVRRELADVSRSLESLTKAQRELDAITSTAHLADPPEPPASLGLLRAVSESIDEDARVVREVAGEQRARQLPDAAD